MTKDREATRETPPAQTAGQSFAEPDSSIDVLLVTHDRPEYTRRSLPRLLSTSDESMRLWIWHNGEDEETLEVVNAYRDHPRVHRFHHSPENKHLREPINWFWRLAEGEFLSLVNDDCLMPEGWGQQLRRVLQEVPELGVVACWHFRQEDFDYDLAAPKFRRFSGGHQVLQNCWVQGSGYLVRRTCVASQGPLRSNESWPTYCMRLAAAGWLLGWPYPLIFMEHMDDPRSPYTLVKSDEELAKAPSLTAASEGVRTIGDRIAQIRRYALNCQTATIDPRAWVGWRRRLRRLRLRVHRLVERT